MSNKRTGITLIEVLVVAAIIATLCALIALVVAPAAKRGGIEARVSSDLRQIAASIRIYMSDYEDQYPPTLEDLALHVPGTPTTPPRGSSRSECGSGDDQYLYTRNWGFLSGEATYKAKHPFDTLQNPVVKDVLFCRSPGVKESTLYVSTDGREQQTTRDKVEVLGVRLDGSVGWFNVTEDWQKEFAARRRLQ